MRVFNMVLFSWPHVKADPNLGKRGGYPVSNAHFDPALGNQLLDEYLDEIRLCDQLGFDGICLQEHHGNGIYSAFTPNTHVTAAAISQITERVHIAITGTCLPLHNPISVAEELALLDHLTKGRLIWGALRGIPSEYLSYSINPVESQARFREAFDLIIKALTTVGTFDYDGQFYRVRHCSLWPRPLQPLPKIWMACNSGATLDFALSRHAYVATGVMDSRRAGALYQQSQDIAASTGLTLPDDWHEWFAGISVVYVDETDAKARAAAQEPIKQYQKALSLFDAESGVLIPGHSSLSGLQAYIDGHRSGQARGVFDYTFEEGIEKGIFMVGSPQTVREQIRRKQDESKIHVLMGFFRFGNLSKAQTFASLQLFADEVLPHVRTM
jgi:alkanesulfonate monooxygenase SsuD/methylene tetrahydromethanopterin reductase-like flavin-dependent oxidoreductase (luciferase family)